MADPVDPTAPTVPVVDTVENIKHIKDAADLAKDAFEGWSTTISRVKESLGNFKNKISDLGIDLSSTTRLTQNQAAAFGILGTTLLGVRRSFDNLSGVDTRNLNTFTGQIEDLQKMLESSPAFKMAKEQFDNAVQPLKALAAAAKTSEERMSALKKIAAEESSFKKVWSAATDGAKAMAASADNALRLQNANIQLAAKTGSLGDMYKAAGPHLSNINLLMQEQSKAVTETAEATQLPIDQVEKYYSELGSIPKALQSVVTSSDGSNKSMSMLTATIQYATGSGRNLTEVVDDMKVAFKDYNLKGEDALKFTARMGEISNKFGVELEDVRSHLKTTADTFKMFGNEAEGAAKMVNSYLGALQSTGISGHVALDVVRGMTDGLKNMTIAQKGFLSAQTGGAGGLMGGFQIEKMMRDGKIDEVFEKVRKQMTRQFGSIVKLDEAERSPQAAAQMQKQMLLLQQGPLGKFAKDDQSAMRILEAFRAKDEGKNDEMANLSKDALATNALQDPLEKGLDIQKQSETHLSMIRSIMEGTRSQASQEALTTVQHSFTAGVGAPLGGADYNTDMRKNMINFSREKSEASGRTIGDLNLETVSQTIKDKSGEFSIQIAKDYVKFFSNLGPAVTGPLNKIADMIKSGNTSGANTEFKDKLKEIQDRKTKLLASNAPAATKGLEVGGIEKEEAELKLAYNSLLASGGVKDKRLMRPDLTRDLRDVGGEKTTTAGTKDMGPGSNYDKNMEFVKSAITSKFGSIVTAKEAEKSPQAAAQMAEQVKMVQQGPLGGVVKSDQDAMKLLDNMAKSKAPETTTKILDTKSGSQDIMRTGVEYQKQSALGITKMVDLMGDLSSPFRKGTESALDNVRNANPTLENPRGIHSRAVDSNLTKLPGVTGGATSGATSQVTSDVKNQNVIGEMTIHIESNCAHCGEKMQNRNGTSPLIASKT